MMKAHELRDLSAAELKARLTDEKKAIQELRFKIAITGQLEDPTEIRLRKRLVARINTILTEQESAN